jgi:hypothetical protein
VNLPCGTVQVLLPWRFPPVRSNATTSILRLPHSVPICPYVIVFIKIPVLGASFSRIRFYLHKEGFLPGSTYRWVAGDSNTLQACISFSLRMEEEARGGCGDRIYGPGGRNRIAPYHATACSPVLSVSVMIATAPALGGSSAEEIGGARKESIRDRGIDHRAAGWRVTQETRGRPTLIRRCLPLR